MRNRIGRFAVLVAVPAACAPASAPPASGGAVADSGYVTQRLGGNALVLRRGFRVQVFADGPAIDRLFAETGRYPVWWRIPEQQLFHVYLFLHWHRLFVDGAQVAEGRIPQTVRFRFSLDETFDVGRDTGTPVVEDYAIPFAFGGALEKVTINLQ